MDAELLERVHVVAEDLGSWPNVDAELLDQIDMDSARLGSPSDDGTSVRHARPI
jgi:hypothetical protein